MDTGSGKVIGLALLMWLLATITVGMQFWVGDQTIYSKDIEQKRELLHFAVLANEAPGGGSWSAMGALSIQKRVGAVYLAEAVRKVSGLAVVKVYKLMDSVFLFVSLVSLFFYLRRWVPDIYSLIGVLYFCAVLPLTYQFQLFHPWDRPQLAIWIGLLYLVAIRNFPLLAFGLVVSIFIKFDTVLLPFFYLLVHFTMVKWRRTGFEFVVLLALAFGAYFVVGQMFPAPLDVSRFTWDGALAMLSINAKVLAEMNVRYPPILVFALPMALALCFLKLKTRFISASVIFGLVLIAVHVMFTNFVEVRAYMVALVLILPSALMTTKRFFESSRIACEPVPHVLG